MDQSDAYRIHVCESCGLIAVANLQKQEFECRSCHKGPQTRIVQARRGRRVACSFDRACLQRSASVALPWGVERVSDVGAGACDLQVMLPYACKLLFQELMSMAIAPRIMT